jgi:repressor LexA
MIIMSESIDLENKIVDFIDSYYDLHGFLPSVRTIADGVGSNKSTVQRRTARLREEGILLDSNIGVVTQRIDKLQKDSVMVGLVGSVSCGPLTFAEQNISEYFTLPTSLVGKGEFFLLQVILTFGLLSKMLMQIILFFLKRQNVVLTSNHFFGITIFSIAILINL